MIKDTKSNLFFCSGLKRSGSTWSYNVCRIMLSTHLGDIQAGYVGEGKAIDHFLSNMRTGKPALLKFHYPPYQAIELVKKGYAKNIYTFRNPLDAIASEMDFFNAPFETALRNIYCGLTMMDKWKTFPGTLFIDFKDLSLNPDIEIKKIAKYFGLDLNNQQIDEINYKTSFSRSKKISESMLEWSAEKLLQYSGVTYDPVTLLHSSGHVSKGIKRDWQNTLTHEQEKTVKKTLAAWLEVCE